MTFCHRLRRLFDFHSRTIDPAVEEEAQRTHLIFREAIHTANNVSMIVRAKAHRDKEIAERLIEAAKEASLILQRAGDR